MPGLSVRIPEIAEASVDEKLALIDDLWESIRRSVQVQVRADHLQELEKRMAAVAKDPSIALSPAQARALLEK
jgi:putative addiction module component (TIGR02574 family)